MVKNKIVQCSKGTPFSRLQPHTMTSAQSEPASLASFTSFTPL